MVLLYETASSPVSHSHEIGVDSNLVFFFTLWSRPGDFVWLPQSLSLLQPLFGGETCSSISATFQFKWNFTICLQNCCQPHCSTWFAATNVSSPMLLPLVIFTLLPERIALDWSGFSCNSAYFWQYPVLTDQGNTGTAFSSQKALGVFFWWTAEWLFAGRGNGGWKSASPNGIVLTLHGPAGGWRLGQPPQML